MGEQPKRKTTHRKPLIGRLQQLPKLLQRPLLATDRNHHENILPSQPLRLAPRRIRIPSRQQLLNDQESRTRPASFQPRHHRLQNADAIGIRVVVQAAAQRVGIGVSAWLRLEVVVHLEFHPVVARLFVRGQVLDVLQCVVDDEREILVDGVQVRMLLS